MSMKRLGMYPANGPILETTNTMAEHSGLGTFHKFYLTLRPNFLRRQHNTHSTGWGLRSSSSSSTAAINEYSHQLGNHISGPGRFNSSVGPDEHSIVRPHVYYSHSQQASGNGLLDLSCLAGVDGLYTSSAIATQAAIGCGSGRRLPEAGLLSPVRRAASHSESNVAALAMLTRPVGNVEIGAIELAEVSASANVDSILLDPDNIGLSEMATGSRKRHPGLGNSTEGGGEQVGFGEGRMKKVKSKSDSRKQQRQSRRLLLHLEAEQVATTGADCLITAHTGDLQLPASLNGSSTRAFKGEQPVLGQLEGNRRHSDSEKKSRRPRSASSSALKFANLWNQAIGAHR
ncbi:unnamed protein product [Protopolystoma xenopodis]|uniref:Uncharacterized protein n=1 Tax=Protopolystoma xenopodis TaxID=117903 RepID=A0A448WTC2_9PLAT|nr:unnamed protein product [Protopolystoma xenopodis]